MCFGISLGSFNNMFLGISDGPMFLSHLRMNVVYG